MNRAPFPCATGPSQLAAAFYPHSEHKAPPKIKVIEDAKKSRDIDVEALKAYRASGKTKDQCARQFGCCRPMVAKLLSEPKYTKPRRSVFDKSQALRMYLAGKSPRVIGAQFGIGRQPISEYIASLHLDAQTLADAMRLRRTRADKDRRVCMTARQAATYARLGGAKWLRGLLDSMESA